MYTKQNNPHYENRFTIDQSENQKIIFDQLFYTIAVIDNMLLYNEYESARKLLNQLAIESVQIVEQYGLFGTESWRKFERHWFNQCDTLNGVGIYEYVH